MRRIGDYSITEKLTWMNMLVSGAALLLACGAFISCETILYRQGMIRNGSVIAQMIGENNISALLFNDPESAENSLAALHASPHTTRAWIFSADGQPFAGYRREGNAPPPVLPSIPAGELEGHWFEDGHLVLVRSVFFHGKLTAYVYLESDLGALYQRIGTYVEITLGVLLASLLAAFLVSWVSRRVVAKPIEDLSETARVVSRDKYYGVRAISTGGRDEISELIETFNSMLAQIQERDAERDQLLKSEQEARSEAERASLLKDEFLTTLSHELRTPLNAILGWSHVLRSRGFKDEELVHGLSVIERNTRAQSRLVEDMLDMSRIISGKTRLDVQKVDLQDVVNSAVASVEHSADAKGIHLQVLLDPEVGAVLGDPGRLQQCLWNLLSNAIKFTPKDGRVTVTVQRVDGTIEITVSDTGEGIDAEFLPHIFERFRQADASTTRRHGGLGLGLSIVKHLVELHGGKVRAQSAGEGRGATFVIELPTLMEQPAALAAGNEPPDGTGNEAHHQRSLQGVCVLALDDDADARDLIKHVLEGCGARVILASSSQEAMELLVRERPDMIISDIGMPGEDGYEFIKKVRALPAAQGGSTPAAALTAFAGAEERTRALRAGYQIHTAKPVKPEELAAVVASLTNKN